MVEAALIERFGPYAGWAHNTLFIAELSSHKVRSKSGLQTTSNEACFARAETLVVIPFREHYDARMSRAGSG